MKRYALISMVVACALVPVAGADLHAQDYTPQSNNASGTANGGMDPNARIVNPYDPKYRPLAHTPPSREDDDASPLPRSRFSLNFVRPFETQSKDDATLRISQPVTASGCITVHPADAPDIKTFGHVMKIKLKAPKISLQKNIKNPHYDCDVSPKAVYTDIPLNREELARNDIKEIVFANAFGQDKYLVRTGQNTLSLEPKTDRLFKANTSLPGRDALTHWFYPENTVILSVPTAQSKDLSFEIESFASQKGLTPLDASFETFEQPRQQNLRFYVDESGHIARTLKPDEFTPIGTIHLPEMWYGPNGPYNKRQPVQVVAKRPGLLE